MFRLNRCRGNGPRKSKEVKELAEKYGAENIVVVLGGSEADSTALAAETVTGGDPTFAGALSGVQLGLRVYHAVEPQFKEEVDESVYEDQVGMMEMVLDVDEITEAITEIRDELTQFKD